MVLCVETPFYQLNGQGMMVEDTVVLGDNGTRLLTSLDRQLCMLDI
ncbi:hypothetical protein AA2016_6128 (plasmid) [Aminobacter aminovorans]|nr:hypothetical protein AA2016_6128 [Aminobacter aminovorans]